MKYGITTFATISCSILKCKHEVKTGSATLTNLTTLENLGEKRRQKPYWKTTINNVFVAIQAKYTSFIFVNSIESRFIYLFICFVYNINELNLLDMEQLESHYNTPRSDLFNAQIASLSPLMRDNGVPY